MPLARPLTTLLGGLMLLGVANAQDNSTTAPTEPVAVVNGERITQSVFDAYAAQRAAQVGDPQNPEVRTLLIDELIVQQLLVSEATRRQLLDRDPTLRLQQRNLLATAAIRQLMEDIQPDAAAIEAEYQALIADLDDREFQASHIMVAEQELAQQIIDELDAGGEFAALAQTHSTDSASADQGGDLGWFAPDEMVQSFSDAVATLDTGSYTTEPVQTDFGWHVILLQGVRESPPPSLESMRDDIVRDLQAQLINDYLMEQRQQADIEIPQP